MNVLTLGLIILASVLLVTSGVLSPRNSGEDVIVREGHRVVVVEFEKDDGNTKISIAPQAIYDHQVENAKEKLSETMKNSEERLVKEDKVHRGFSPKELVCDGYGKCKRKVESVLGKAKEVVADKVHEAEDIAHVVELEEDAIAREAAGGAVGKVRDMASDAVKWTSDKTSEAEERAKDAAHKVYDKAREAKEGTKDATSKAKDMLGEKAGRAREGADEMVDNASKRSEKGAYEVKEKGKKDLTDISRRAREVAFDMFEYAVPPVSTAFATLHLLGFAAAYGMCVWVTFASSYVLASALPRHQFGIVQSKIYPAYFKAMAYSVGMALLGHLMISSQLASPYNNNNGVGIDFQVLNLMVSIMMILVNLLYLQPYATKVMLERMKEGERGGRSSVTMRKSEMLNSTSSFLNFMTLMSLTCHLLHLGRRINTCC